MSDNLIRGAAIAALFALAPNRGLAQALPNPARPDSAGADSVVYLATINVTATLSARSLFDTPASVSVLGPQLIERRNPSNIAELFLDVPGLDAEGVGVAQRKPMIRGMLGQRVLLLEDGLRLNNTRRQQDRGETPSLVDPSRVERVEIVRGASSVLYGSDAVGGVINIITERPRFGDELGFSGAVQAGFGSAGSQRRTSLELRGRTDRLALDLDGSYRDADPYDAPKGTFGNLSLATPTRVHDTGVEDYTLAAAATYRLNDRQTLTFKHSRYRARNAGFGFVDPGDIGTSDATLQLLFPEQRFNRTTAHYRGTALGWAWADRLQVSGYVQSNEREFHTNVSGPLGPPGATLDVRTRNFTDIDTYGFRVEAQKLLSTRVSLTYGTDFFRDGSQNSDTSTTIIAGLGPTTVRSRGTRVPNASFASFGVFLQSEFRPHDRVALVLGARWQNVDARSMPTDGITNPLVSSTDRNLVGAANIMVRISPRFNLLGSVGRAFRSPNLVERFFEGPSPEGRGFWTLNPDLQAETSFNREVGGKYLGHGFEFEGYVFRNSVFNGIRGVATGDVVGTSPVLRNENVDRLTYTGLDLNLRASFSAGFHLSVGYSHLDAAVDTSAAAPSAPFGDGYSDKLVGGIGFRERSGRVTVDYTVRYTDRRDGIELAGSPIGLSAPAFTVHSVTVAAALLPGRTVIVSVRNLTNALYAETANVAFFRPEPGRNVTLTAAMRF